MHLILLFLILMIDIGRTIPGGVICFYCAWSYYGLSTQIPDDYYIAFENYGRVVHPNFTPIFLCYGQKEYYEPGVTETEIYGYNVLIYNLEKSVYDVIKFRNKIGKDICA